MPQHILLEFLTVGPRVHSHLRLIRRELLHELFSPQNDAKSIHNPLLNFSVQIASVNVPA